MRISDWSSDVCSSDPRQLIERQLLGEEFKEMGLTDRRAAGLAIIQMTAAVRGLALERLLNRDSPSSDDALALQKSQTEEIFRELQIGRAQHRERVCLDV